VPLTLLSHRFLCANQQVSCQTKQNGETTDPALVSEMSVWRNPALNKMQKQLPGIPAWAD
jgi:hypothetical protein